MRGHKLPVAGAVVLVLGFLLAAVRGADEDLRAAMDRLAKTAADKPDALEKEAAAVARAHKIDNDSVKRVMELLGKRDADPPGWGVGKPGAIKPDGIEAKLRDLVRQKAMSKAQLEREADALLEMAQRTAAVGAVGLTAAPRKKPAADWKDAAEDMIKSSRELAGAVTAKDPEAVKSAAGKVHGSCVTCHAKFRD